MSSEGSQTHVAASSGARRLGHGERERSAGAKSQRGPHSSKSTQLGPGTAGNPSGYKTLIG